MRSNVKVRGAGPAPPARRPIGKPRLDRFVRFLIHSVDLHHKGVALWRKVDYQGLVLTFSGFKLDEVSRNHFETDNRWRLQGYVFDYLTDKQPPWP